MDLGWQFLSAINPFLGKVDEIEDIALIFNNDIQTKGAFGTELFHKKLWLRTDIIIYQYIKWLQT